MTAPLSQGEIGIERMCRLAGLSRAGYYRHWQVSAPRQEAMGLRDAVQRMALENRHYGYRRIAALLGRDGWCARTISCVCGNGPSCRPRPIAAMVGASCPILPGAWR
jgi:hypothetical protein